MERPAPVRKSHTSTADLLIWPEGAPQEPLARATPPSNRRPHQPSEAVRKVVFGGQVTEEEFESLNKRKPCSAPKWKEMTGSGIFAAGGEVEEDESANASATPIRTAAPKNYQVISTISHISFAEEESVSPKKPTSIAEVAKQRELSGTLLSEDDSKMKRQISDLKSKELSGHDIFAPPEDPRPRNSENDSTSQTPGKNAYVSNFKFGEADEDSVVKTAKKIPTKKFTDLTGNGIFKGDETPGTGEAPEHGEAEGDDRQRHLRRRESPLPGLPGRDPQAAQRREQHRAGLTTSAATPTTTSDGHSSPYMNSFLPPSSPSPSLGVIF